MTDSEKNIRGFLATNGQLLGHLTCKEADSAFQFAWGAASGRGRNETRMTALATLGPFLSDVVFREAMHDAKDLCERLLTDAPIPPGSLNRMLSQCAPRELRMALLKKHWGTPGELGRLAKLLGHLVVENLWGFINDDTLFCSLEFLLSLTAHECNEVRRSAIDAVLPMTRHPRNARPTCAALTHIFASSHPGSKHTILNALESGGLFDPGERSHIIRTASSSSCYYVRMRAIDSEFPRFP